MGALGRFEWERLIRELSLPPPVRVTAYALATFANSDGTKAYCGLGRLGQASGLIRNVTVEVLAALRGAGLIRRTKRGGGRGVRLADEYELSVPDGGLTHEQVEWLVAAEYDGAREKRRAREHARYESRKNESRNPGNPAETNHGNAESNHGNAENESRHVRDCTTPTYTTPINTTPGGFATKPDFNGRSCAGAHRHDR